MLYKIMKFENFIYKNFKMDAVTIPLERKITKKNLLPGLWDGEPILKLQI